MLCFTEMYQNYFCLTAFNVDHNKFQQNVLFLVSNGREDGQYCLNRTRNILQYHLCSKISVLTNKYTVQKLRFSSEEQVVHIMSEAIYDTHSLVCLVRYSTSYNLNLSSEKVLSV
jgi:hypothetical protein